jgi:hypothetical protein
MAPLMAEYARRVDFASRTAVLIQRLPLHISK